MKSSSQDQIMMELGEQLIDYGCPATEVAEASFRLIEFAKLAQRIMNRQNREANESCNPHQGI